MDGGTIVDPQGFVDDLARKLGTASVKVTVTNREVSGLSDPFTGNIELGRRWSQAPVDVQRAFLAHEFGHSLQPRAVKSRSIFAHASLAGLGCAVYVASFLLGVPEQGALLAPLLLIAQYGVWELLKIGDRRRELEADRFAAAHGCSWTEPGARAWITALPSAKNSILLRTHPSWERRLAACEAVLKPSGA